MNYLSLIFRIMAILSAGIACALYFSTADKIEEKERQLSEIKNELQTLIDKNETMSLEFDDLQKKSTLDSKIVEEAKIKVEEVKSELVAEMQESQHLQSKLIESERKVSQLEETTKRLREGLLSAEKVSATSSQEGLIAQLSDRIEELTKANEKFRNDAMEREVPLAGTVSGKSSDSLNDEDLNEFSAQTLTLSEASAIEDKTRIASLSKENGIIVLSTDSALNLKPNTVVKLVKDLKVLAQVEVISLNGALAIANILPGAKLEDISKGDIVKILR